MREGFPKIRIVWSERAYQDIDFVLLDLKFSLSGVVDRGLDLHEFVENLKLVKERIDLFVRGGGDCLIFVDDAGDQ